MTKEERTWWRKQFYEGTNTLRNRLDIRDYATLQKVERSVTAFREAQMPLEGWPAENVAEELRSVHRFLFKDIYDWAGAYRAINFTKNNDVAGRQTEFANVERIGATLSQANGLRNRLAQQSFDDKVRTLGAIHSVLDVAHPFLEGNGRATRALMRQTAWRNGIRVTWPEDSELVPLVAKVAQIDIEQTADIWAAFYADISAPRHTQTDFTHGRALSNLVTPDIRATAQEAVASSLSSGTHTVESSTNHKIAAREQRKYHTQ